VGGPPRSVSAARQFSARRCEQALQNSFASHHRNLRRRKISAPVVVAVVGILETGGPPRRKAHQLRRSGTNHFQKKFLRPTTAIVTRAKFPPPLWWRWWEFLEPSKVETVEWHLRGACIGPAAVCRVCTGKLAGCTQGYKASTYQDGSTNHTTRASFPSSGVRRKQTLSENREQRHTAARKGQSRPASGHKERASLQRQREGNRTALVACCPRSDHS
jgi:hypothetical protein